MASQRQKRFFNFITKTKEDDIYEHAVELDFEARLPTKVRFFIWLTVHEKLATNNYQAKIGLSSSDVCPRCNQH